MQPVPRAVDVRPTTNENEPLFLYAHCDAIHITCDDPLHFVKVHRNNPISLQPLPTPVVNGKKKKALLRDKHYLSLGLESAFEDLWTFAINAHVQISLNFAHPDKHNPPKTLAQPLPRPKTINCDVFKGFAVDCGLTHGDLGEAKRNPILIGMNKIK